MIQKKTNVNLEVRVWFPAYYRINRHGRKIAKVAILCNFNETQIGEKPVLQYEAKCKIFSKKNEIVWEISKDCNDVSVEAIKGLYTKEEIFNIFEEMEDRNCL